MKLKTELDVLLALARELVQAEDDAEHQLAQLYAALMRNRASLKRTRTLAQATARRLRVLARRLDLDTPATLARTSELATLEALLTRATASHPPRTDNVVALRRPTAVAPADPASALEATLRQLVSELGQREALVLCSFFGIDLSPRAPFDGRYPQGAEVLAKTLGISEETVYLDFERATAGLREPTRAARLRPFYEAMKDQPARGPAARLLRFIFETRG